MILLALIQRCATQEPTQNLRVTPGSLIDFIKNSGLTMEHRNQQGYNK